MPKTIPIRAAAAWAGFTGLCSWLLVAPIDRAQASGIALGYAGVFLLGGGRRLINLIGR